MTLMPNNGNGTKHDSGDIKTVGNHVDSYTSLKRNYNNIFITPKTPRGLFRSTRGFLGT